MIADRRRAGSGCGRSPVSWVGCLDGQPTAGPQQRPLRCVSTGAAQRQRGVGWQGLAAAAASSDTTCGTTFPASRLRAVRTSVELRHQTGEPDLHPIVGVISPTASTPAGPSRRPLTQVGEHVVHLRLRRVLGFGSHEAAWAWMQKLRRAMVCPGRDKLSGVVELDTAEQMSEHFVSTGDGVEIVWPTVRLTRAEV